ncbi:hypothetical protein EUX98_g4727 [Antrodiella citrinella]|uniref:CxC2-like cysteine cluster KDZ transposase-associated domain-containing protein n=1 Tax=Antrodiella citrinella TaxID=2447956 RepID=A0A4S4MW19_9APHY|nr:hypothetical protein EUX98_g4727 [Antrodiella citrinella]
MEFIPEFHSENLRVQYYEDGMLGGLEYFKWPQVYDEKARFAIAAPGNPDLMFSTQQSLPVIDDAHVLPNFADPLAPWTHMRQKNFVISKAFPSGEYGSLDDKTLHRLRAAMLEVGFMFVELQDRLAPSLEDLSHSEKRMIAHDEDQAEVLRVRLLHTMRKLQTGGQMPFITMLLFREFQRVLLALRGWVIYYSVIWPRLNAQDDFSEKVLPLRGAFSDDTAFVAEMYRVGVPVWYIRPLDTINSSTVVNRSVVSVSARKSFSASSMMHLGCRPEHAPSWTRKAYETPTSTTLLERIEVVSVSRQAFVLAAQEYNPARASKAKSTATANERVQFSFDDVGPGMSAEEAKRREDICDHNLGAEIDEMVQADNADSASWVPKTGVDVEAEQDSPDSPTGDHFRSLAYSDDDVADEPPSSRMRVDHAGTSSSVGLSTSAVAGPSSQQHGELNVTRQAWVPVEAQGWSSVVVSSGLGDVNRARLLYFFPCPQLFYGLDVTSKSGCRRLHNWLRIRVWCLNQALNSASHGVLWTKSCWRIAMDGEYYRILDIPAGDIQPLSSAADIAQLPVHIRPARTVPDVQPRKNKRLRKGTNTLVRGDQRRRAERVDVNVRFGVHAQFKPHDESEAQEWGRWQLSQADVNEHTALWREIVWELSVVNFRLELFHVDRVLCPHIYADSAQALLRSDQIISIWSSDGAVLPDWTRSLEVDLLNSSDDFEHGKALQRFAVCMSVWPGGSEMTNLLAKSSVQPDPTTAVSSVTPHVAAEIHSDGVQDGLPVDSQDGLPLDLSFQVVQHIEPDGIRPNRKKKEKQWRTWDTVTIPLLVRPPVLPTLAVDVTMLEFMRDLFVRLPPNVTAWCGAVEAFLWRRQYRLEYTDSLRQRLGKALQWFTVLVNEADRLVQQEFDKSKDAVLQNPAKFAAGVGEVAQLDNLLPRTPRPSGISGSSSPVLSIEIEEFVEEKRGWKKKDPPSAAVDDKLEEGMKVPNSILESCGVSFKAADERRVKASTKYFADTGLMALVCRHDRTIWLANMTSAGEKQHYALALLFQLLKHLPADATIGVLYDIACQLERSCRKYDYFGADLSRFDFALAVFHAYAHEWACQIIYHPRKCIGYGLTDGEGCERGWRVLQKLIPGLRVSGYHQRKMVLDEQILFNRSQSLTQLASWLVRKWGMAYDKMTKVEGQLRKLRVGDDTLSDEELRAEHAKQVVAQTKPLPRQQKNAGKEAVKQVMQFQRAIEAVGSQIKTLDAKMSAPNDLSNAISGEIMIELNASRAQLVVSLERYELRKLSVMSQLGAVEQEELRQIKMSEYLTCHVNAHALCTRIIHRMRNRRFELDRLERSYRTAVNEAHLEAHITQSMKSRQSTISNLVKRYNTLCDKMQDLIGKKKAPKNAVAPRQIKMEGLFKLDVDHDVWQDLGFGTFDDDDIPLWLSSEKVREGIRHVLELDRCREEVERLGWERCALQEWFMVEWKAIVRAIETTLDENIKFQLEGRQNTLLDLYLGWEGKLKRIHAAYTILDGWGPSWEEEHAREAVLLRSSWKAVSASRNTEEEEVDLEKDDDAYYDGEEGDAGLMQDVETSHEQSAFVEENDEWLQMMDTSQTSKNNIVEDEYDEAT